MIDPTVSLLNIELSMRRYIGSKAATDAVSVSFDDEVPDISGGQWVVVTINESGGVSDRGIVMVTLHTSTSGTSKEIRLLELRDTIVGWFLRDSGDMMKSIPLLSFDMDTQAEPVNVGNFFVEDIVTGNRLSGEGGVLYRQIIVRLGYFARP